jgi:hypothetical protein
MLYQDRLTGMLHEVPDNHVNGYALAEGPYGVGEGQVVYDGLGNPLGWGFLKKLVKRALPLAKYIPGPYGQLINRALPMVQRSLKLNGFGEVAPMAAARQGIPIRRPLPGWVQPQVPNMGPQPHPRRLYLRCATWRGPGGMVPLNVAPMAPGASPQVPIAVAPQPVIGGRPRVRAVWPTLSRQDFRSPLTWSNVVTRVSTLLDSSLNAFIPSPLHALCAGTVADVCRRCWLAWANCEA